MKTHAGKTWEKINNTNHFICYHFWIWDANFFFVLQRSVSTSRNAHSTKSMTPQANSRISGSEPAYFGRSRNFCSDRGVSTDRAFTQNDCKFQFLLLEFWAINSRPEMKRKSGSNWVSFFSMEDTPSRPRQIWHVRMTKCGKKSSK